MSRTALLAGLALACATGSAFAHVENISLSDPHVSPDGVYADAIFTNYGWFAGTRAELGDSHALADGAFFTFHLDQASFVTLEFEDASGSGLLNPAFSLYSGLLFEEAHDDAAIDPLNPKASTPPFGKIQSSTDNGVTTDASGRVSPFRDTRNFTYAGQFDALHSWSMGNAGGQWSVIDYIAHAGPKGVGNNLVGLYDLFLEAGDYTIAAGGGNDCRSNGCADASLSPLALSGIMAFSAVSAPVPEPETWAMLLAGLGLVGAAVRRRTT